MVRPLILTWNRGDLSEEDYFRQLFVYPDQEQREKFIGMVGSIGAFIPESRYISILRPDDSYNGGYYITDYWTIERGDDEVYKPLAKMNVI